MKRCPNCNAELSQRPCAECGWPKTTRSETRVQTWLRRTFRASHPVEDDFDETPSGCCGCWLFLVVVCAALGYWLGGQQGAALGAVASAVLAVWVQLDLGGE